MSGVSLSKFNQIKDDQQVVLDGQKSVRPREPETGNLFGKMFKVLSRGDVEKDENNKVTQSFFQSLREAYGDRITDYAIKGYESREFDGKPLTGYRIQQIIARAQSVEHLDGEALERLVGEQAPSLLEDSLKRAGIQLPEQGRKEWQRLLNGMVESEIRNNDKFKDPRKLESSSFAQEFQGVVDKFVSDHRKTLSGIGTFEQQRQEMLAKPEDHGNWGMMEPKELESIVFRPNCRKDFIEGFGNKDGQIGDFDTYWREKIVKPGQEAIENRVGPGQDFRDFGTLFTDGSGSNGVYRGRVTSGGFLEFNRLDQGIEHGQVRDEKFHVSVKPEDMGRAWKAIAPILLREDCPVSLWKVANIESAQRTLETNPKLLEDFEAGKDIQYDGRTFNKNGMDETQRQTMRDRLNNEVVNAQRIIESCQFTIYPMEGEESGKFIDVLDEIERALHEAGIEAPQTPGSDESVNDFVSFRIAQKIVQPNEPGYRQAYIDSSGLGIDGRAIMLGDGPVFGRIDPQDQGYPEFKLTFRDNPFYRGQSVNLTSTEINRLRESIDDLDGEPQTLSDLVGQARTLRETVDSLEMTDGQRARLEERLDRLDQRVREHVGAPINGLVSSYLQIEDNDVAPEFGEAMSRVHGSSLDGTTGARLEHLLSLAGKIRTGAMNPNLGFGERLQLSVDMQTLRREFDRLLDGEFERLDQESEIDMAGKLMVDTLRKLDFDIPLGNVGEGFSRNGQPVSQDNLVRLERAVRALGAAGVMVARGVDIDQDTLTGLQLHMTFLDGFLDTHQVSDEFRPKHEVLTVVLENVRQSLSGSDQRVRDFDEDDI
jgi:hypothetical protein